MLVNCFEIRKSEISRVEPFFWGQYGMQLLLVSGTTLSLLWKSKIYLIKTEDLSVSDLDQILPISENSWWQIFLPTKVAQMLVILVWFEKHLF